MQRIMQVSQQRYRDLCGSRSAPDARCTGSAGEWCSCLETVEGLQES